MRTVISALLALAVWGVFVVYLGTLPFYYPVIFVHLLLLGLFFGGFEALFAAKSYDSNYRVAWIGLGSAGVILLLMFFSTASTPWRVGTLRNLGGIEVSKEKMEVADVKHIRLIPAETAIWKAQQKLGTGKLGSLFEINRAELQRIGDSYYYLCPLEFIRWTKWMAAGQISPGYVKVSAESPHEEVVLVTDRKMRYTFGAWYGSTPSRKMFFSGMSRFWLYEQTFETDDAGKPYIIMKYTRPTVSFGGGKLSKIVILDCESGDHKTYNFGKEALPKWVDRAFPGNLAIEYAEHWGVYVHGYINIGQKDAQQVVTVLPPDSKDDSTAYRHAILVNNRLTSSPIWFVGMTSPSISDNSMTGYVAADSVTGKMVFYEVAGFGNERNVIQGVMGKQDIAMTKNYHAADPIFYRIYGVETWIVPVLTPYHIVEKIAISYGPDPSQVVVGDSKEEALEKYQALLSSLRNPNFSPTQERRADQYTGEIVRMSRIGGNVYFTLNSKLNKVFFAACSGTCPELYVTQMGDKVVLRGGETEEGLIAVSWFDNLNLKLAVSAPQQENLRQYEARRQEQSAVSAEEVRKREEELKKLKDESRVTE